MKRAAAVLVGLAIAILAAAAAADASTTTVTASPKSVGVGQKVTFTARYTSSCAGAVQPHYFTIDGKKVYGKLVTSGLSGTETYSTTTLTAGTHVVTYFWQTKAADCLGSATISYAVSKTQVKPSPSPSPKASPSPAPSPSPTAAPTSAPSPTPVAAVTHDDGGGPVAYLGVALIAVSVVAGIGLVVFGRRS